MFVFDHPWISKLFCRFGGIKDHDYCSEAYEISQKEPQSPEELKEEKAKEEEVEPELSEMDKILSDVAMGSANLEVKASPKEDPNAANSGSGKKKKKKKVQSYTYLV